MGNRKNDLEVKETGNSLLGLIVLVLSERKKIKNEYLFLPGKPVFSSNFYIKSAVCGLKRAGKNPARAYKTVVKVKSTAKGVSYA